MYVPKEFALEDEGRIADTIRRHRFAVLVTAPAGAPQASHLPFLYDPEPGSHGTLTAHMARVNPQWRDFAKLAAAGAEALVVFQGPHAYVSPSWYGTAPAVPTWNYLAVHAYGVPRIIDDPGRVRALLERLVATQESGFAAPWSMANQDEAFLTRMMRAIVAFEIPVSRLESKAKLNQNKRPAERRGVMAALVAGGDPRAAEVAALMAALAPAA